jgi:hypothetical protein
MVVRWLTSGTLDHVPATVLDHCPKLLRLFRAVGEHPGVKDWLAKSAHRGRRAAGRQQSGAHQPVKDR